MRPSAGRTKSLMPMKCFIRFAVVLAQFLDPLHFGIVFFRAGKELKQPGFEQLVRLGRLGEKLLPPCA